MLVSFCCYSCDIQVCCRYSLAVLQGGHLVSLELTGKGHLGCILKHSVAVVVTLGCHLIVDAMMLTEEAVGSDVEG